MGTTSFPDLNHPHLERRLEALDVLCRDPGRTRSPIDPVLPSYVHVHTAISYGREVPGVYSVTHMLWAAHQNGADTMVLIEHESMAHFEESREALRRINRLRSTPFRLILGIEFKVRIVPEVLRGADADRFRADIRRIWGQDELSWIVAMGCVADPRWEPVVRLFQEGKRVRAERQLELLARHLRVQPVPALEKFLTGEGNITDRQLCFSVASVLVKPGDIPGLIRKASEIRRLLNLGQPAYVPCPPNFPSITEMSAQMKTLGTQVFFTAQLRGQALHENAASLKRWGIDGLDTAGVEPDDPGAKEAIQSIIDAADRNGLGVLGGSDYRGTGSGWTRKEPWMNHPLFIRTLGGLRAVKM
jgi:hypothetical protein